MFRASDSLDDEVDKDVLAPNPATATKVAEASWMVLYFTFQSPMGRTMLGPVALKPVSPYQVFTVGLAFEQLLVFVAVIFHFDGLRGNP